MNKTKLITTILLAATFAIANCKKKADQPAETPPSAAKADPLKVGANGMGWIKLGLDDSKIKELAGQKKIWQVKDWKNGFILQQDNGAQVNVVVKGGKVKALSCVDNCVDASSGIAIGDSEADVKAKTKLEKKGPWYGGKGVSFNVKGGQVKAIRAM